LIFPGSLLSDLYNIELYNDIEDSICDLVIQIQRVFVEVEEKSGNKWYLYNSVLCSENGRKILGILAKYGATTHIEIENETGIIQQTANTHLQKLIKAGIVEKRPIVKDPQIKGRFRPFIIYCWKNVDPERVVHSLKRFKKYLLKEKLTGKAINAYNNIEEMAYQVVQRFGVQPTENQYKRILAENNIKTQKEWDILVPELRKCVQKII
jgi:predicted transcriptional regulator